MLDFSNFRYVFVDFDHTLGIENYGDQPRSYDYWKERINGNADLYLDLVKYLPNQALYEALRDEMPKAKKYVLTWTHYSMNAAPYWRFLETMYPEVKFEDIICCCSRKQKAPFIRRFMDTKLDADRNTVLFIDDRQNTVDEVSAYCTAIQPMYLYARRDILGGKTNA